MNIDTVKLALDKLNLEPEVKNQVINKVEELAMEEKSERSLEKQKRGKKQYVITLKGEAENAVGAIWVIGENDDPNELVSKIQASCVDNNLAARKAKNKITKFDDAVSFLKNKFLKTHGIKKMSKDWERVLILKDETLVVETPVVQ